MKKWLICSNEVIVHQIKNDQKSGHSQFTQTKRKMGKVLNCLRTMLNCLLYRRRGQTVPKFCIRRLWMIHQIRSQFEFIMYVDMPTRSSHSQFTQTKQKMEKVLIQSPGQKFQLKGAGFDCQQEILDKKSGLKIDGCMHPLPKIDGCSCTRRTRTHKGPVRC